MTELYQKSVQSVMKQDGGKNEQDEVKDQILNFFIDKAIVRSHEST